MDRSMWSAVRAGVPVVSMFVCAALAWKGFSTLSLRDKRGTPLFEREQR
jgi:hypothetical protein